MTPISHLGADWPAVSALLDEALDLPASNHESWLNGLVGKDALHRETLRLLLNQRHAVETDDFLGRLPELHVDRLEAPSVALGAGSHVGAYRLISQIGCGGMGTVWLAERSDGLMKRRVALKLPRIVWGEAFAERLAREREILSTLDNAHIARLYDAGIDVHGRPFLAMEYVEGESIQTYCRVHSPSLLDRIALLRQVMAAVAHAHARLVVHRDLKPSNILVNKDGQVKLLDFGIAKLLEGDQTRETALTEIGGHAMTLDYASPEQIRGEPLGTASDIYSMAVVAYELLCGVRPYRLKRASAAELEEAIATGEPPMASGCASDPRVAGQLRGDLDSILNKALKKAPSDRYRSMDAFAQDLHRYVQGEPVEARPDGWSYRASKFVRRYRLQVAAGAVVMIALVTGTSVALWQAREAVQAEQRAKAEAATAHAVQAFLESVFLINSGDQADPVKARATTARELLDRGAERIDVELRQQPAARLRLLSVLASMYESMALVDRLIEVRRKQWHEARSLFGPSSEDSVTAMAKLADALTTAEQRPEAAELLRQAAAMLDARGDHDSRARFWVEITQASLDRRIDARHGLAASQRALAIARKFPPDAALMSALVIRGENASFVQEYEQARDAYAEYVRLAQANPPLGANDLGLVHGALAEMQAALGLFAEADASQRKGVATARLRQDPLKIHHAQLQLAILMYRTGRFRDALAASQEAARWAHSAEAAAFPGPAHWMKVNNAVMLLGYGRSQDALDETDQDPSLTIEPAAASGLDLAALSIRSRALTELGRLTEARAVLDRARSLLKLSNGKLASASTDRAEKLWLVESGRASEALAMVEVVRAQQRPSSARAAPDSVGTLAELAWLKLEAGEVTAAQKLAEQVLAAINAGGQAAYQRDHEARATLVLGRALLHQDLAPQALPLLGKAVQQHLSLYDPDRSPAVARAWSALAEARRAVGDPRAAEAAAEARRVRSKFRLS